MPRRNRPARRGRVARPDERDAGIERVFSTARWSETRRGREFTVQRISPANARKEYTCPACHRQIAVGLRHLVVIPADHLFGDDAAVASRRHWHENCWQMG